MIKVLCQRLAVVAVAVFALGSCTPANYDHLEPRFDIEGFFNGELHAYGIVRSRGGELMRRFKVNLLGTWEEGVGTLDEQFLYDDGERAQRVWTFVKDGDGNFSGTANDTLSTAILRVSGPELTLNYNILLDVGDSSYEVRFDDWIYAIDNDRVINVSEISKFGLTLGEVILVMERGHQPLTFD
ncbi:DUF3833 family protein [Umboniibacter marinipuniceus]|uniref:Uncharacterized protein DUF3833 n=1 Tax=Umboniibacter marinipuniceus TaxID=569599 RepID=A0A3M0A770_9GAMM|nr:DUF3833 family protein [Umboniibacter marinipuniceus]RMA81001.1 uncharacterized protein DUF3833 [Umboniibacter marinipuniceus]